MRGKLCRFLRREIMSWKALAQVGHIALLIAAYFVAIVLVRIVAAFPERPRPFDNMFHQNFLLTVKDAMSYEVMLPIYSILIGIPLSVLFQYIRSPGKVDMAFYPRLQRIGRLRSSSQSRMTMIIGGVLLACYWVLTSIPDFRGRPRLPSERVFCTVLILWGVVWIADTFSRAGRTTYGTALTYLYACLLVATVIGVTPPFE